ncbi:MAG: hypothetical protein IIZ32_02065, partial [Ruminococcus sp.]|nr:hypothetical protein [Ruminococcus sp.]
MVKRISKRLCAAFLSLCVIVSMATVGMVSGAAATDDSAPVGNAIAEQAVEQMIDDGLRAICMGMDAVGEATGNGDVQKVFSVIEEWAFMSTEEIAIEELKELCEEILNELKELEEQIASDDAYITSMLADQNLSGAKDNLNNAWQSDVKNYLTNAGVLNALSAYREYLTDAVNGESEDKLRGDLDYLIKQYALMSSSSINTSGYTVDNLKKMMFETNDINKSFITLISNLASALSPHGTANATCAQYAAQVAYMAYPFSHQQYTYVHEIVEEQLATIMLVEMAYNEYLYQQGKYLSETYHDEDEPNGWYAGYLGYQQDFYDEMNRGSDCVNARIEKMLNAKMNADGGGFVMLSLSDYMKPEDAVTTTLRINDYTGSVDVLRDWADKCNGDYDYKLDATDNDGTHLSNAQYIGQYVKFKKVMTHSPAGNTVYYILDPEQFKGTEALYVKNLDHKIVFHGLGSDTHTESCDYLNLCREMTDGANTFIGITDKECTGFSDLLTTNYFSIRDSKVENYLSGSGKYLPDAQTNPNTDGGSPHNFVLSSDYSLENNMFDTNYAKIKLVDCERQFPDCKPVADYEMDMEHGQNSVDECYTVFLRNKSGVFSQIAHAEVSNPAAGDIKLTADGVHFFGNGESTMVAAGKELTVKMKSSGGRMTALKLIRNADSVSGTAQNAEELLLDEAQLAGFTPDAEGYITAHFTMPYSDATYRLEIDDTVAYATISSNDGGTATFEDGSTAQYCKIGEKATVYVAPESGYALHSIYLEDAKGNMLSDPVAVDLSKKRHDGEDAYSFTMPAQSVTVKAYFTAGNTVRFDTDTFQFNDNGDKLTYLCFVDDPDATSRVFAPGFPVSFKAVCDPSYADNLAVTAQGVTSGKQYALRNENDIYTFDLEKEDVVVGMSYEPHTFVNGFCTECGLYEKPVLAENGYYQITNAGNLFWISALTRDDHTHAIFESRELAPKFELVNDIDLESRQWEPIASITSGNEFKGVFEGNGHTIDNFYFRKDVTHPRDPIMYYGMFISCDGACIRNFTIKGKAEIVCNLPDGEHLDDLYTLHFATIAGGMSTSTRFSDIFSYVDITAESSVPAFEVIASGITNNQSVDGIIERCVNFGDITGDLRGAAGIVNSSAYPEAKIDDCANIGTIKSTKNNVSSDTTIAMGGIVRIVWNSILFNDWCSLHINNCCNYGQLGNANDAISDTLDKHTFINNCYYLQGSAFDINQQSTAHTAEQFKSGETGYLLNRSVTDGTQAWYQNIDNGRTPDDYPLPDKSRGTIYYIEGENRYSNYPDGKAPEPEIREHGIRTYDELVAFAETVNGGRNADNAYLENNITAPDDAVWTVGIGTESKPFNGTFDGRGHCITGLRVDSAANGGLFDTVGTSGVVKDLSVVDCDFRSVSANAGGIIAVNNGTIDHCTSGINLSGKIKINGIIINDVSAYNSYIRGTNAGGIAAVNNGTITGCRSSAVVEGVSAGGVTALNKGNIYGSANNGMAGSTENSGEVAGGIAGTNYGVIASCYDSGKPVNKNKSAKGMIAGDNQSDDIRDVFYTNVDGNTPVGDMSDKKLPDASGLVSTDTMLSAAFVDTLNGVTDDSVTWLRAQYGSTSFNQGYPVISGRYLTQRTLTLQDGITVSSLMHDDLQITLEPLAADSEDYRALAETGSLLSAYSFVTTDKNGSFAPSELWSAGGYKLSIPTGNKSVVLIAQNTEGETVTIAPESIKDGSAVFTVAEVNCFAVAERATALIGDVNRDGKITIDDATLIQKYAIELPVDVFDVNAADVNRDGRISILDTTCVQKYLAEHTEGIG